MRTGPTTRRAAAIAGAHRLALFARELQTDSGTGGDPTIAFRVGAGEFARLRDGPGALGLRERHGAPAAPGAAAPLPFRGPDGKPVAPTASDPVPGSAGPAGWA
jgi:hypothetical protein